MSARATVVRWSVLAGLAGLLAAGRAHAAPTPCSIDLDCPNAACGGDVCIHSSGLSMCVQANTSGASGINDGWCASSGGAAVNSNCKCASMGATCEGFFCSFTIPQDGGTGGSTGTGGSGTGTGGSGTGTAGTGGGDDGGCSIAGAPSFAGAGAGAGLVLLAAALRRRRARRRV